MTRTPAAPKLSETMIDVMLHALTTEHRTIPCTQSTGAALVARGYATAHMVAMAWNDSRPIREYRLTDAGTARAAKLRTEADDATEAALIDGARVSARRIARVGSDEREQPHRAEVVTDTAGEPLEALAARSAAAPLPPYRVRAKIAAWLLDGATVVRSEDGRVITVTRPGAYTHTLTATDAPAAAPGTLPGVVARVGEPRPAFADDPANPERSGAPVAEPVRMEHVARKWVVTREGSAPVNFSDNARAAAYWADSAGHATLVEGEPTVIECGLTRTPARAFCGHCDRGTPRRPITPAAAPVSAPVAAFGEESGEAWPTSAGAVRALMSGLRAGDSVRVRVSGREHVMTVQRELHHQDGTGAPDSYGVMVGWGPGRYNRFIGIDTVVAGFAGIALAR